MKKALSLVEVLISIILISVVIAAMLQIKSNNIFMLEKFKNSAKYNSYIAMSVDTINRKEKKIYLDSLFKIDDRLRQELKKYKIAININTTQQLKLPSNSYVPTAQITELKYTLNDNIASKVFYIFKLEYN